MILHRPHSLDPASSIHVRNMHQLRSNPLNILHLLATVLPIAAVTISHHIEHHVPALLPVLVSAQSSTGSSFGGGSSTGMNPPSHSSESKVANLVLLIILLALIVCCLVLARQVYVVWRQMHPHGNSVVDDKSASVVSSPAAHSVGGERVRIGASNSTIWKWANSSVPARSVACTEAGGAASSWHARSCMYSRSVTPHCNRTCRH